MSDKRDVLNELLRKQNFARQMKWYYWQLGDESRPTSPKGQRHCWQFTHISRFWGEEYNRCRAAIAILRNAHNDEIL